jgi:glycosyltransferase involved in cell wall biosynthesis
MRILQVIPHLSKGGAERVVIELSNALGVAGHEITVLVAYPVRFELNQKNLNPLVHVNYISTEPCGRLSMYRRLLIWTIRHRKSLKDFDVIHCHLTLGMIFGVLVSILRRLDWSENPKLVATCHMVGGGVSWANRYFNRRVSYFFDAFVLMAQDDYWRSFIAMRRRTNIHIVPNGISIGAPSRVQKTSSDVSSVKIGTISRLYAERKPQLFLEVFSEILKTDLNRKYRFVIGGTGPEEENLKKTAIEMGISDSLTFTGLVKDPNEILGELDIYLSLNVEGITGIAGLEAVSAGVPVVALQLSPRYLAGADDWIWSNQEPANVAARILEISTDPAKAQMIAHSQRAFAQKNYSVQAMTRRYLEVYEDSSL